MDTDSGTGHHLSDTIGSVEGKGCSHQDTPQPRGGINT
jgi:hypothetical protein